jgi:hypothetical protein
VKGRIIVVDVPSQATAMGCHVSSETPCRVVNDAGCHTMQC